MSKQRKTIKIETFLKMANDMLLNSDDKMVDGRKGVQTLIEQVLFETNNYNGFRYLSKDDMAKGHNYKSTTVGINMGGIGNTELFQNTDMTRVRYL
jgi:hypothetical protein